MPYLPDPSRRVAHILLDTVDALDSQGDDTANELSLVAAIDGLNRSGAVTITDDPEDGDVVVDLSELFLPMIVLVEHLTDQLAEVTGTSKHEVLAQARAFVDRHQVAI